MSDESLPDPDELGALRWRVRNQQRALGGQDARHALDLETIVSLRADVERLTAENAGLREIETAAESAMGTIHEIVWTKEERPQGFDGTVAAVRNLQSSLAAMREERDEARRDEAAMRMAAQMVADDHRRLWPLVSAVRNAESVLRDVAKNYGPPEVKALLAVFDALYDQPTTSAAENQAKLVAALSADTAKTGGTE